MKSEYSLPHLIATATDPILSQINPTTTLTLFFIRHNISIYAGVFEEISSNFPTKIWYSFLVSEASYTPHHLVLDLITLEYFRSGTNEEDLYYATFSSILSLLISYVTTVSSASCSKAFLNMFC
jgi:hypothetical protein